MAESILSVYYRAMDMMSGSFLIPEKNLLKSMFLYFPQNVKMNFILYLNRFMILSLMTNVSKVILQLICLKQIWIKPPGTISQPPFLLNTRNRTLEKNGQRIKLTQVEYSIMRMFMENPGKALSREEILDLVWGRDYFGELKIVDVNVRRLRLKIEDSPTSPTYINTVWGYGYKWGF